MNSRSSREQPEAAPKTYKDELGWRSHPTAEGITHTGYYRVYTLKYRGWILQKPDGKFQFFIQRPPFSLIKHTEFAGCFHEREGGVWLITFKPYALPNTVSSGIVAIQNAMRRAFEVHVANRGKTT